MKEITKEELSVMVRTIPFHQESTMNTRNQIISLIHIGNRLGLHDASGVLQSFLMANPDIQKTRNPDSDFQCIPR